MPKKQVCRLLNWQEQNKGIKKWNHRVDWWIMVFKFYYNQWNFFFYSGINSSLDWREDD